MIPIEKVTSPRDSITVEYPRRILFLLLLLAVIVTSFCGCAAVGPNYQKIEPTAPAGWHAELSGGLTSAQTDPVNLAQWWTVLDDPQLAALEERAVKGNLELKVLQARIREARAMYGIGRSRFFPTLAAGAAATEARSSESSGSGTERELYYAGIDASWELDVFGGVQRAVEAAQASLEGVHAERHDLLVSLLAEVALNYLDLRTYQARLAVSSANIKIQQESYALNNSRFQAGLIGELAVQTALRMVESSHAQIPTLEAGLEATKNRLAVLLGQPPGSLHQE
ncbi:MAG: TolC family protein, partial [Desulfuromonadales bacterium]|nr:TolC family protein [Desulfuromonadales bacterium]